MAAAYVEMLVAFWRDNLRNGNLSPEQPLYVLEFGAGSGVFSYAMVRQLFSRLSESELSELTPIYIISDLVPDNLEFCRTHEKLAPYIAKGQVDLAVLDVESEQNIHLLCSGKQLINRQRNKPPQHLQRLQNPLSVIANYVFDGLTQDLVYVHYGKLYDGYMAVENSEEDSVNAQKTERDPNLFPQVADFDGDKPLVNAPVYEWRPMPENADIFTDSERELMGWYQRYLDTSAILIPSGAMACIDTLNNLSTSPLMMTWSSYLVHPS